MLTKGVPREKHHYCCTTIGMAFISDREAVGMSDIKHALTCGIMQGEPVVGPASAVGARAKDPPRMGGTNSEEARV